MLAVSAAWVKIMKWPATSTTRLRAMRSCMRRAISRATAWARWRLPVAKVARHPGGDGVARGLGHCVVGTRAAPQVDYAAHCLLVSGLEAAPVVLDEALDALIGLAIAGLPQERNEGRLEQHERAHGDTAAKRGEERDVAALGVRDENYRPSLPLREGLDRPGLVLDEVRAILRLGFRFPPPGQVGCDQPQPGALPFRRSAPPSRRGGERAVDQDDGRSGSGGPECEAPALEKDVFHVRSLKNVVCP